MIAVRGGAAIGRVGRGEALWISPSHSRGSARVAFCGHVDGALDLMMSTVVAPQVYARWTGNRALTSLGTNDGAPPIAFQKWHNFKEAFAPELIHEAVNSVTGSVERCIDPFGGSGTTALTCQMLGIASTTVEVNPYLADVIRAKLHRYDPDSLVRDLRQIRRAGRRNAPCIEDFRSALPPTFVEPGVGERWIFDTAVMAALVSLLRAIDDTTGANLANRRFFRVVVGGLLTEVSNVIVSGKGRRYRQGWRSRDVSAEDVYALFAARAESAISDVVTYSDRPIVEAVVHEGDARVYEAIGEYDLSVFSPPYPNSFDYTDVYNVQLWVLGYLTSWEDNALLRRETLSSHVQVSRQFRAAPAGSATLDDALNGLQNEQDTLWNRHLPAMVGAYFTDLLEVTESVLDTLRARGECWIVVGDSRYATTHVPVGQIVAELLSSRGHFVVSVEPVRHMRTSAQQGFRASLAESLLKIRR